VQFSSSYDDVPTINLLGEVAEPGRCPKSLYKMRVAGEAHHQLHWDDGSISDFGQLNGNFARNLGRFGTVAVRWRPIAHQQEVEQLFTVPLRTSRR